jgi:archaellum biogenesis ATPase FlaH
MNNENKLVIKSFSEVINDITPEPAHIIGGGILPRKALLLVTGQPKARKSFLVQNLALAISAGISFACFTIESPKKVLILSAEGGYFSNRERFKKMAAHVNNVIATNINVCFDANIKLEEDSDVSLLKSKITSLQPEVVIVDPLVKFHGKDENASNEMAKILNKLRELIEDNGISIILVHHQGKDSSKNARGSSAILGEYDAHIKISKDGNDHSLEFDLRHAAPLDTLKIQFNPETFWFELSGVHPLVALVRDSPGEKKQIVVQRAVELHHYETKTGAYKAIKKLIDHGHIRMEEDTKLYLGSIRFSTVRSPRRMN